jgi:hypothetical protein
MTVIQVLRGFPFVSNKGDDPAASAKVFLSYFRFSLEFLLIYFIEQPPRTKIHVHRFRSRCGPSLGTRSIQMCIQIDSNTFLSPRRHRKNTDIINMRICRQLFDEEF